MSALWNILIKEQSNIIWLQFHIFSMKSMIYVPIEFLLHEINGVDDGGRWKIVDNSTGIFGHIYTYIYIYRFSQCLFVKHAIYSRCKCFYFISNCSYV